MTAYSAFFSSGLLAPRSSMDIPPKTPSKDKSASTTLAPRRDSSPIRPASPLPSAYSDVDSKSDSDVDMDGESDFAREATPTQHSVSAALAQQTQPASKPIPTGTQPRLRKRRSSLTLGTSPITAIRGPTRNAGAALQLQRHLMGSGSRSRSGSTTAPPSAPLDGGFAGRGGGRGGVPTSPRPAPRPTGVSVTA
ncbi:hypothetical protein NMY22_g20232 [Coprinellus aureogranulatus]|nr:hypothetical protein NMY22_g20232 [Coprinellus aureogranulatus]